MRSQSKNLHLINTNSGYFVRTLLDRQNFRKSYYHVPYQNTAQTATLHTRFYYENDESQESVESNESLELDYSKESVESSESDESDESNESSESSKSSESLESLESDEGLENV